jgi:hypothetical protein
MASQAIALVWGGGRVGLMGTVADAVLASGGKAYGVIPDFMAERELAHPTATGMLVVPSMHARKAAMAERADGFVALPGGLGTYDELFEILTWAQLHLHHKPVGLLNVRGYFDPWIAMVEHGIREGFIHPANRALFTVAETPDALLAAMTRHTPPPGDWLEKTALHRG